MKAGARGGLGPALLVALAGVLASAEVHADGSSSGAARVPRPYDAPLPASGVLDGDVPGGRAKPDLTPEYASMEEQGVHVVFHLRARDRAASVLTRAVSARAELSRRLGREVLATVELRLAASPLQLIALSPPELPIGATTTAFAAQHLAVVMLGSAEEDPSIAYERVRHALAHLALDEVAPKAKVPAWFHEGFALDFSGAEIARRGEILAAATLGKRLLETRDLASTGSAADEAHGATLAAAESAELAHYLQASEPSWKQLVAGLEHGQGFGAALLAAEGADLEHLEPAFRRDLARRFAFVPVLAVATLGWMLVLAWVMRKRRHEGAARAVPARSSVVFGGEPAGRRLPDVFRIPTSRAGGSAGSTDDGLPTSAELTELGEETVSAPDEETAHGVSPDPDVPKIEHDGRWHTLH